MNERNVNKMYFFVWFGKAKSAFLTMCIIGGIAVLFLLSSLISVFFNLALAKTLLICSLPFIFFALIYMLNWLSCRRRDRKREAKIVLAAQSYQQGIEQQSAQAQVGAPANMQPGQVQPQGYYPSSDAGNPQVQPGAMWPQPAPESAKPPGQGLARVGLILGIIGLVLISLVGLAFFSVNHRYYDVSAWTGDLILYAIIVILPVLSIIFGISAKRREYLKKSASASVIIGGIGTAIAIVVMVASAIIALSNV